MLLVVVKVAAVTVLLILEVDGCTYWKAGAAIPETVGDGRALFLLLLLLILLARLKLMLLLGFF